MVRFFGSIVLAAALHLPTATAVDRLRGSLSSSPPQEQDAVAADSSSDPYIVDIQRAGIDRSLATIHIESELNIQSPEQLSFLNEYITRYSADGNTDNTHTCPFDYEGDVDPFHPSSHDSGRTLMGEMDMNTEMDHAHMHYVESSCNAMVDMATCVDFSDWVDANNITMDEEVKIPCGECVTLDAAPGQKMEGLSLELGQGLNIVGKLVIPALADFQIRTKYVFVQGLLQMLPPPPGTQVSSKDVGPKVKFTLYGTEEITFMSDAATDNAHLMGEPVSAKAFVVAGGKVDIQAIDSSCPSWVKLKSVTYGTPLVNVALGKPASQSSTYNINNDGPEKAVDGNYNSFTHTKCWETGVDRQWWKVDLLDVYTISSIVVGNRLDCCGGRFHDATFYFYDENEVEVAVMPTSGGIGSKKTFSVDAVDARYVKVEIGDGDCLQIGEFEVYGWLASEGIPLESMDRLHVGEDAANCWKSAGSRIMLSSDTYSWSDSHVEVVADVESEPGTVAVFPLSKKKSAEDETFGYPDFAVEVALLDRSFIIEGAKDEGAFATLGGHFMVLHTPHVNQHLEGALMYNMGQEGKLGRYPLHFHMSECVHGSTLSKNVIWESNQRCVVVHGTHNVTVSENVAYDTKGHCFMLEDGGEWDNSFIRNLGAKVDRLPQGVPRDGESDFFPSVFWITNPQNEFIGNVAAGSRGAGFWFELKLRAPSSELVINHGVNPKTLPQKTFKDNASHSSGRRAGFTTYETGYHAPPGTKWENIKSYKNGEAGLFQHGTTNIQFIGGLLADNGQAAHNFHHDKAVYDGVEVIGRSQHMQFLIDEGRISSNCNTGGISLQPNEGMGQGTLIKNSHFHGFDTECTSMGGPRTAIHVGNNQVRNGVFDNSPTIFNNTFQDEPLSSRISACWGINNSPENWVRYVSIEDVDGSLSGNNPPTPGFFVQNDNALTTFLDTTKCQEVPDSCLLFCTDTCLRLGIVSVSQDFTTRDFQMHITEGSKTAIVNRGNIWFDEKQNHLSAPMPLVLPAPAQAGSKYQITFTDKHGDPAWPGYASLNLERAPSCTGGFTAQDVEFIMPDASGDRCLDLFKYDDFGNGVHGWQNFFAGIAVSEQPDVVTGAYVINTLRRKDDRGHVNLSRTLDVSCLLGNVGRAFHLFGKIRMKDRDGNDVATDGTSQLSPKVTLSITGGEANFVHSFFVATLADGSWADISKEIVIPSDIIGATKAQLIIDKAEKMEFFISDWGMNLIPSDSPTLSPSHQPSDNPTPSPTSTPSISGVPTSLSPTKVPVTAAPVSATPTNLALSGLASSDSECWNGFAYKAIDGNDSSINHNCCNKYGAWLMVDLGLGTENYIEKIVVKNRKNCCGGRLKLFYVELLDADKQVVHSQYHGGTVGNGGVREFIVNDGTVARYARIKHADSHKDCFHIAELEVWGYPTLVKASAEPIIEMAQGMNAVASSSYNSNANPLKALDGNDGSIYHSKCGEIPWWEVDLGVMSFVRDVVITNRKDCCGGRLKRATVELLDENHNLVESRYIEGSVGNGQKVQKVFNEDDSLGRYVRVSLTGQDCLQLAEVEVFGNHLMGIPTTSPTPIPSNLSLNKPASQSSTYNINNDGPEKAVDGNYNSFTHTKCWETGVDRQWWKVDLLDVYTISSIVVGNRLDCCGGRFHDATFYFYDENEVEVAVMPTSGGIGSKKTFSVDFVDARYVKVEIGDGDCLQIGEFEAWGW